MNKNNFITGKQLSRLGQVFTLIWGLTIFILCLMPASDLPEVRRFPNLDKIVHFTFYFVLTVSTFSTLLLLKKEIKPIIVLIGFFSFSFFIEVLQAILPFNRSFSGYDLIANSTGLAAGYFFFKLVFVKIISLTLNRQSSN